MSLFDSITSLIPDDFDELFTKQVLKTTLDKGFGALAQGYRGSKAKKPLSQIYALESVGTRNLPANMPSTNQSFHPTRTNPAETVNPSVIEAAWMARLSKYAGISQSTGAKI